MAMTDLGQVQEVIHFTKAIHAGVRVGVAFTPATFGGCAGCRGDVHGCWHRADDLSSPTAFVVRFHAGIFIGLQVATDAATSGASLLLVKVDLAAQRAGHTRTPGGVAWFTSARQHVSTG